MQKSTWLIVMAGLFLTFTLIWAVPGYAQAQGGQGGMCPRGYNQGAGQGYGPGYCAGNPNPQTGSQYGPGYCYQNRGKNRARWNNSQNQANPNYQNQTQPQTPAPQSGN